MNVTKVISQIRETRRRHPISVYHRRASPSIQLNSKQFNELVPFMKILFKAFDRQGFSLHIGKWGNLGLYSNSLGIALLLKLKENSSYLNNSLFEQAQAQQFVISDVNNKLPPYNLKYFFYNTRSKWRSIEITPTEFSAELVQAQILDKISETSKPFHGRLIEDPFTNESLTVDDIFAIADFAVANFDNVWAWISVSKTLRKYYVTEFAITEQRITLRDRYSSANLEFAWQKNDLKFIKKFFPTLLETVQ